MGCNCRGARPAAEPAPRTIEYRVKHTDGTVTIATDLPAARQAASKGDRIEAARISP